jgi:hypothetical protein
MRFSKETLGILVRPRILTSGLVLAENATLPLSSALTSLRTSYHSKNNYVPSTTLFGKTLSELFSPLNLGNTTTNKATAYVAKVVSYVVKVRGSLLVVDNTTIDRAISATKKQYGSRTNLKVVYVGVQFFQGFDEHNTPLSPVVMKTVDNKQVSWFFNPKDLVSITEIVKYESAREKDLILFPKSYGLVVKKKFLNKPKFYMTSSWSCYAIILLNPLGDGFVRFLPDRQFEVHAHKQNLV